MTNWQPTACILCSRNCGLSVQTEGGHLVKIRGDKQHPISAGYLCQKATKLDHYQNHADRLRQPLRRNADGNFEAVSWDTAITEITAKLLALRDAHGNTCMAYYGGGGQGNHVGAMYASSFRKVMGIPHWPRKRPEISGLTANCLAGRTVTSPKTSITATASCLSAPTLGRRTVSAMPAVL